MQLHGLVPVLSTRVSVNMLRMTTSRTKPKEVAQHIFELGRGETRKRVRGNSINEGAGTMLAAFIEQCEMQVTQRLVGDALGTQTPSSCKIDPKVAFGFLQLYTPQAPNPRNKTP